MPKILTYNSPPGVEKNLPKDNSFKTLWEKFQSSDKFTKFYILAFLLIVIATPFLVNNLLETRQRAEGPTPTTAQVKVNREDVVKKQTLELLSLTKELKTNPGTDTQTKITSLVKERKTNLLTLIEENPEAVLKIALSENIRNSFSQEIRGDIESNQTIEGALEVIITDDFDKKTTKQEYFLNTKDKVKLSLYFAQKETPQALTGEEVKVKGVRLGDKVAIASTEKGDFEILSTGKKVLGTSTVKKVAVILFNFQDDTSQPYTPDQARQMVFTNANSTNGYYKEVSFGLWSFEGKLRIDGDVFGWYTVPYNKYTNGVAQCPSFSSAINFATGAAIAAGVDLSGYTNIMIADNCLVGAGFANPGGVYSYVGGVGGKTAIHELGHNFGLAHANILRCHDASGQVVSISGNCYSDNAQDYFDVMGYGGYARHFNNFHKEKLGFFDPSNIQTIGASGAYAIAIDSIEPPSAGVKALKIPRRMDKNVVLDYYYVEFRETFGLFDDFPSIHPVLNGVSIRIAPYDINSGDSALIDATPATDSSQDQDLALPFGQTFTDPATGISIKAVSKTSTSSATVDVTYSDQCIRQKPSVDVGPIAQWGTAGQTLAYNVTVVSNDRQICNGTKFTLSGSGDPGFTFSPASIDLTNMTPGKTVTTTINVTSATNTADGFYPLTFSANNNGLRADATANYNVASINPSPTPTPPSTSPTPTSVPITQPATNTGNITGTVSSSLGGVVIGAKIGIKVGKTNLTYTTDSFGNYVITGLAPAPYTLKFSAQGYVGQSASVTVTSNNTTTQNITLVKR